MLTQNRGTLKKESSSPYCNAPLFFTFSYPLRGTGALQWHMLRSATRTPSLGYDFSIAHVRRSRRRPRRSLLRMRLGTNRRGCFRKSPFVEGWGWILRGPPRAALTCGSATSRLLFVLPPTAAARPRPPAHPAVFPGPLWPECPLVSLIWPIRLRREARVGERGSECIGSGPEPLRTGSAPGRAPPPAGVSPGPFRPGPARPAPFMESPARL